MSAREGGQRSERIAVALEYTGDAPKVTAQGRGALAEEILRRAEAHDIPLRDDRDLVELLATLPLNQEIPAALYRAVAEVIAFAYLVKGRQPGTDGTPDRDGN